ncbi:hypothetical protein FHS60_000650 [Alloprevotella rava]|uniref:Uncharacterized protein n=1 Tax=Alloprevotella rava TaxID=671218 RepID=A0A7W5UM21_9BACT|nr:hypothetical protein [Alloprevotella rava]
MLDFSTTIAISVSKKTECTHKEVGERPFYTVNLLFRVSYRNFVPIKRDYYGRALQNTVGGRL